MQGLTKGIENNPLAHLTAKASPHVVNAIQDASAKTGVNFAYMVQQAAAESSFNPTAKAKTSSATGLYQFIKSTWMDMINRHGDKHGIETEGMSRSQILDLRKDPEIASMMAAEFAAENQEFLERHWAKGEKDIGSTELYFAHFMGAGGAAAFLNARDENPLTEAATLFPKAAKANYNVFYERNTGRARSLDEVYAFFDKKFAIEDAPLPQVEPEPEVQVATAETAPGQIAQQGFETSRIYTSMFTAQQRFADRMLGTNPSPFPSNYNSLLQNPIDLMLMTQLALPSTKS